MLPLYPFAHLLKKAFRTKNPDDRAEGKQLDQQLGFIRRIIEKRTKPGVSVRLVNGLLFVIGEMEHASFQSVSLVFDADAYRFILLL